MIWSVKMGNGECDDMRKILSASWSWQEFNEFMSAYSDTLYNEQQIKTSWADERIVDMQQTATAQIADAAVFSSMMAFIWWWWCQIIFSRLLGPPKLALIAVFALVWPLHDPLTPIWPWITPSCACLAPTWLFHEGIAYRTMQWRCHGWGAARSESSAYITYDSHRLTGGPSIFDRRTGTVP